MPPDDVLGHFYLQLSWNHLWALPQNQDLVFFQLRNAFFCDLFDYYFSIYPSRVPGLFGFVFFLIYWFLYFLAFLLLISTSLWFYFVCGPFLPYSSRTWIWSSAVTILFYSLPINFFNSAIAPCCFRKSMFSLIFLQSSSFFSPEVLICLIISFYLSKSHLF